MDFVISLDEETWDAQPLWLGQPDAALWAYPAMPMPSSNNTARRGPTSRFIANLFSEWAPSPRPSYIKLLCQAA